MKLYSLKALKVTQGKGKLKIMCIGINGEQVKIIKIIRKCYRELLLVNIIDRHFLNISCKIECFRLSDKTIKLIMKFTPIIERVNLQKYFKSSAKQKC